ncbi:MAG: hypothetical protein K2Y18_01585 [Alphaproteobacteria bacterium]|nr:hypothetical protein [Alphaproteobacteria bacterium]
MEYLNMFKNVYSKQYLWKYIPHTIAIFLFNVLLTSYQVSAIDAAGRAPLEADRSAFIVEVPFYCPPLKIQDAAELIKQEPERVKKKLGKRPKKSETHNQLVFMETDFMPGHEPYRIAEDEFRGFLRLYTQQTETPNTLVDILENPRAHEHAKPMKKTTDEVLQAALESETIHVNKFVNLFRSEAFGESAEESKSRFDQSMKMVLLLNRYKSVSSTLNKSLKRFNGELDKDKNIVLLRGFWEPKWQKKVNGRWYDVPLKEVRHFFLEYLRRNKEKALEFLIENEGGDLNGVPKGRLKGIFPTGKSKITFNTHVPYQELREAIRVHPSKLAMAKALREKNQGSTLYEGVHDSDLVGLRVVSGGSSLSTAGTGLYSHYENGIRTNNYPDLITTGYCAAWDERFKERGSDYFSAVSIAIEEDRYVRAALSQVDSRLAYYSEPNILIKVPSDELMMPYSFLESPGQWSLDSNSYSFGKYSPHESLNILRRLYARANGRPKIVLDPSHPVMMRLPDRMLVNKHTGTPFKVGHYDEQTSKIVPVNENDGYNFLKISENVSQSPLSFRDYSIVAYTQLGLVGGTYYITSSQFPHLAPTKIIRPNSVFTSLLSTIFNSYDPIELIEGLHGLKQTFQITDEFLSTMQGRVYYVCDQYERLTQFLPLKFASVSDGNVNANLEQLNKLSSKSQQLEGLEAIFNPVFRTSQLERPMTTLIEAAKAMGRARNHHIKLWYSPVSLPIVKIEPKEEPQQKLDTAFKSETQTLVTYSEVNYQILLGSLKAKFPLKTIVQWAGYSQSNAGRDFKAMQTHRNKKGLWEKLVKALNDGQYSIEEFLKSSARA